LNDQIDQFLVGRQDLPDLLCGRGFLDRKEGLAAFFCEWLAAQRRTPVRAVQKGCFVQTGGVSHLSCSFARGRMIHFLVE
jgi:hypothetical protein